MRASITLESAMGIDAKTGLYTSDDALSERMVRGMYDALREEVPTLKKSARVAEFLALMKKVQSGTATPAERTEYEAQTKAARDLAPNVLVD